MQTSGSTRNIAATELLRRLHEVRSGLTKKAEPPPTRDVNRDSGTDSANGGWLRRLVRPHGHKISANFGANCVSQSGLKNIIPKLAADNCWQSNTQRIYERCSSPNPENTQLAATIGNSHDGDNVAEKDSRKNRQPSLPSMHSLAASLIARNHDICCEFVCHTRDRCGLTKKAEPPPTRGVNRDSGTASANGGWLRRLVRPHGHHGILCLPGSFSPSEHFGDSPTGLKV